MVNQANSEARERVLQAAERLFAERGYQVVTLRDIAQEIGIRHASLYYHFPRGKEELYVEVMTSRMQRYRRGLEQAIQSAGEDWQERLRAAGNWLLAQPALNFGRMLQSDMPAISEEAAEQLRAVIFASVVQPLEVVLRDALAARPEKRKRSATLAGMFLSLIEGVYNLPPSYVAGSKHELVDEVLDLMVNGLRS